MKGKLLSIKRLLPSVLIVIVIATRGSVAFPANCLQSNCQFNVTDECQHSVKVFCNLRRQPIQKITITKTSFPEHVQEIVMRNVEEMKVQADAIASLKFLKIIELENIGKLTLLPRSLAHPNGSGLTITIRDTEDCHMTERTVAPSSLIRNLHLVHINNLTIDNDAFAATSSTTNMWMTEVKSLTVKNGAFAAGTTIQYMQLEDIESMTLHTGGFARHSSIQQALVDRVPSLFINSGGIQADISELTIKDVTMATCESNTFYSTIQSMSLASSHIHLIKSGCISANGGWKNLLVEDSKFNHIESQGIRGTIDHVEIKNSNIGIVDTEGFHLNVTRFTLEGSTMIELSDKTLAVSAAEVITLNNCTLAIPCNCDIKNQVLQLGTHSQLHRGHGNGPKTSRWLKQIHCENSTTTPTLAKYHGKYCPDNTTNIAPPKKGLHNIAPPGSGQSRTGNTISCGVFATIIVAFLS